MKHNNLKIKSALLFGLIGISLSCKKDFGDINTNQTIVTNPDVKFLLAYSEDKITTYQGTEWIWESFEQLFRYTQHMSASPFELSNNINTRYSAFYGDILPNLVEIRRQIDTKPDKESYQKMAAVTYVLQVLHGLKVTDMNGSIPYTEAIKGRTEGLYNPKYDEQQSLLNQWITELNAAIATLENASLANQASYNTADIYYQGDFTKWAKLGNTLKLRIAARLERQDVAKTREIFQSVLADPLGPISSDDDQLKYLNANYTPFSPSDIDYRSRRFGSTSLVNFMKKTQDPRLPVYFDPNSLTGAFKDSLQKYNVSLPAFININDPLIMYQGGPADWTTNPTVAAFMSNTFPVGPQRYNLISPVNRRFFSPKLNNASGNFLHVLVSYAETCFYIAEFVQKGYAGAANTKGSAAEWYNRGITSSIKTMNTIATQAGSATAFTSDAQGDALIATFINSANIKFNGANDLERIYVQQYVNFFRLANEAFVFTRRTGYPKNVSAYYQRETFNEVIPRRFYLLDPGERNRANWTQALQSQGFTLNSQNLSDLSTQKIWYDKTAPAFGGGQ